MKKALATLFVVSLLATFGGCSEKTQTETEEALQETGEAVESAADDAAENTGELAIEAGEALTSEDEANETPEKNE